MTSRINHQVDELCVITKIKKKKKAKKKKYYFPAPYCDFLAMIIKLVEEMGP